MEIYTRYFCRTYIADGKHISASEPCFSAADALVRAERWRACGTKAEAVRIDIDLETLEVTKTLL